MKLFTSHIKYLFTLFIFGFYTLPSHAQVNPNWINTELTNYPYTVDQIVTKHDTIYAISQSVLYYSYDNLVTWDTLFLFKGDTTFTSVAAANSTIIASTNHGVFMSLNNGQTITQVDTSNTVSIAFSNNNIYAGTYRGVNYSSDMGQTWTINNSGLQDSIINTFAFNGSNIFAGSLKGFYKTDTSTLNWTKINIGTLDLISKIQSIGSNIYACSNNAALYVSADKGGTWSKSPIPLNYVSLAVQDSIVFVSTIYGTSRNGVYASNDKGQSWTSLGFSIDFVNTLAANSSYLFAGTLSIQGDQTTIFKYKLTDLVLGIKDKRADIKFNVYPVPSQNGIFTLELLNKDDYIITVSNSLGEIVNTENTSELSQIINLSKFKKGVYFLKIESKNAAGTKKIVID
jgi:photosystem II stability/assembly factor-like uncharacterized protein